MNHISLDKHKEFGMCWKILNRQLVNREDEILRNAKNKVMGRHLSINEREALKSLSKLRSCMEEIMCKDYPNESNPNVYYGGVDNETKI